MLQIDTRDADGITVLDLKGTLVLGEESQSLAQYVREIVSRQPTCVLVNLSELTFIDSCGVGELIASFTTVKKHGGTLKLSGARDRVQKVLQVVRMPAVVELYATEQEALASFD